MGKPAEITNIHANKANDKLAAFPHQRETVDKKANIRVISIFNGSKTASRVIHDAAVKKILYGNSI